MSFTGKATRALAILFASIYLAGCKLAVIVPEGGYVTWNSADSGTCTSETTCVFDVTEFDFARDHRAVPDPGWEFLGWRLGPNYFCGGSLDNCDLSLKLIETFEDSDASNERKLFAGVKGLLANGDVAFFLEPIFHEIGAPVQKYRLLDNPSEAPLPDIKFLREDIVETNAGFYFKFEDIDSELDKEYVAKVVHSPAAINCADWCWVVDYGTHHIHNLSPNVLFDKGFSVQISYTNTETRETIFDHWGLEEIPRAADSLIHTNFNSEFDAVATSRTGFTEIALGNLNDVLYNHDGEWRLLKDRLGFTGELPDIHGKTRLVAARDSVWIINYDRFQEPDRAYEVFPLSSREYPVGETIHQMVADSNDEGVWALVDEGLYFFRYDDPGIGWRPVVDNLMEGVDFPPGEELHRMAQDARYVYTNYFKAVRKRGPGHGSVCRYINNNLDPDDKDQLRVMKDLYYYGPVSVNDRFPEVYFIHHDTEGAQSLGDVVDYIAKTEASFLPLCPEWTQVPPEYFFLAN